MEEAEEAQAQRRILLGRQPQLGPVVIGKAAEGGIETALAEDLAANPANPIERSWQRRAVHYPWPSC